MGRKIFISYETLQELYCNQNLSQKKVAEILKCNVDTVAINLKKYNIKSHKTGSWLVNKEIILNSQQLDYINGALLGDGCLTKPNKLNTNFSYVSKCYQHVKFVSVPFENILFKENIKKYTYFDKRTMKEYSRYSFRTELNKCFTDLYKKWYINNIKHIPQDLILNNTICLIWYIGDGCLSKSKNSYQIKLATHCFKKEDIEKKILPQLSCFSPKIYKTEINKEQYCIYIPRSKCEDFLKYIGECPFKDYQYKWNILPYKNKVSKNQEINSKIFVELYKNGKNVNQIAKIYNIDGNTVKKYLVKEKVYKFKDNRIY